MKEELKQLISFEDFLKVDIRSGTIIKVEEFPRAKKPAYKVWVDFGPDIGVKQTSAQITKNYTPENLLQKQVMGCVNLGPRNIAGFISEFLLLGFADEDGSILLAGVEDKVQNGQKLH